MRGAITNDKHPSVLLVDLNEDIRGLQRQWLEADGWKVKGGFQFEEITDHLDEVNLIVTGGILPEWNEKGFPDLLDESDFAGKVLLCSATPADQDTEWARSTLAKPFNRDEFLGEVRTLVEE